MKNNSLLFGIILIISAIFLTNCKKDKKIEIGQKYEGGIIFYIDGTGKHGMVCAESDQSSNMQWWNGTYITINATGTAVGTGNSNTNAIVSAQGNGNYAAKICYDLTLNGYSDWYLPSIDELYELCKNQLAVGLTPCNYYWSSSEYNNEHAWRQGFCAGYFQEYSFKEGKVNVRAVRSF